MLKKKISGFNLDVRKKESSEELKKTIRNVVDKNKDNINYFIDMSDKLSFYKLQSDKILILNMSGFRQMNTDIILSISILYTLKRYYNVS